MEHSWRGRSAVQVDVATGRGALGLATEDDLLVDASADLAVDATDDFEISPGVIWSGASAAKVIKS